MAAENTVSIFNLPPEIRLRIYACSLDSVDIHAVPGEPMDLPKRIPGLRKEFDFYEVADDEWCNMDPPTPIHILETSPELLLTNKRIRQEVMSLPWESHVRFVFDSTVEMLDVLLEWPRERVERIRRLKIYGTPLPVYPIDNDGCYHTHGADSGLALLKGLQLDLLEYEDVYLPEDDGWGRGHILYEMRGLMKSLGWRELHYLAREPYLQVEEVESLVSTANTIRQDERNSDFEFDLPSTPVGRDKDKRILGMNNDPEWIVMHDRQADIMKWDDKVDIILSAKRAKDVDHVQHEYGNEVTPVLKGLLARMTWRQLRESGDYLVADGTVDPCNHL